MYLDMIVEAENDHETKEEINAQLSAKNQAKIDVQQKIEEEAILMALLLCPEKAN